MYSGLSTGFSYQLTQEAETEAVVFSKSCLVTGGTVFHLLQESVSYQSAQIQHLVLLDTSQKHRMLY